MLTQIMDYVLYGAIASSLFLIDYSLGNGFVNLLQKIVCKIACFIKKSIREEAKYAAQTVPVYPINLPVLFLEIFVLTLITVYLKKFKLIHGRDRIDELIQESKDSLLKTNEFLEKWRLRRINWQVPTRYDYLDDEPQDIKPLKLEVPILHMAIIDTRGAGRNQLERGDAGDSVHFTDSTVLSVTSLVDDDDDLISDHYSEGTIIIDEQRNAECNNRYLWDVMEEDSNTNLENY